MKKPSKFLTFCANFCARFSVRRWNPFRPLRLVFRRAYRGLGDRYIAHWQEHPRLVIFGCPENTYPWPYSDPRFANWEEDDSPQSYTLITDPANFVIRRSASYVAWKIFELTGKWPLERGASDQPFHARNWQEFLQLNGYSTVATELDRRRHYVGIIPDEGEFGQVVWFEGTSPLSPRGGEPIYVVSTYRRFEYVVETNFDIKRATWVEIEKEIE